MHYTYSSEYPQAWIESKWPCGWYELTIYIYIYMCFLSSKPPTPPLRSRSRTSPWPRPRLQPVRCGQSSPVLVTEQPNSDGGHPKPTITDGLHMCVFYSWFMIDSVVRRLVFQLALYMLPRNQPETSSSQHTRRVVLSPCCTKMRPYMYIYIYISTAKTLRECIETSRVNLLATKALLATRCCLSGSPPARGDGREM